MSTTGQLTMFPQLARQTNPHADIQEPRLWFRELRLLRQAKPDTSKENLIRKFDFRAGLNVLWAEPEPADSDLEISGLYADGFSGHATGKTLFCRILRHLIGDTNFATQADLYAIQGEFIELWAVAELRLDGTSWIVGRSMTGPGKDFATVDMSMDTVLGTEDSRGDYKAFQDALEKSCAAYTHSLHPDDGWRHLLPWLTRDQEARFSAINAWRDPLSEADNPRTTSLAQHLLMRSVLNILDPSEAKLRENLDSFQETVEKCGENIPEKQRIHERDMSALRMTLSRVDGISLELKNLQADQESIATHIEVRNEALAKFRKLDESDALKAAKKEYQDASSALEKSEERIRYLKETEIPSLEKRQKSELLLLERIKTKGVRDPKRANDNFCPNSYILAQDRGCVKKSDDEGSQVEISELIAQAEELEELLVTRKTEQAALESKVDQLEAAKTAKREKYDTIRAAEYSEAINLQKAITTLESAKSQIEQAIASANDTTALRKKKKAAEDLIVDVKNKLILAKMNTEGRLQALSHIYSDVIGAILGASVSASVSITERGLQLKAERNGNLGGTALATIKTIAFDIAAVIQSIEGKGHHPRFLIHDGPREGDMARIVYARLFLLARHVEEAFQGGSPTFQYILTTTTPPPSDMQEGSEWLLCEPMKGNDKSRKLLRRDY